ncbi:MAG: hypothetical protein IKM51_00760 [Oscillospiraceae bacterium]|nr:hypothetical protein [Oscillospiraceae bacterium]
MKKRLLILPLLLLLLVLSGCMLTSASDLYMLPEPAEGFVNLESKLDEVIALGAEYSAPLKGSNRQAVQLVDLNGDDVEEAVAFFRLYDQDKPLRMYIFKLINDSYESIAVIEADGTAFDVVEYRQLDGTGALELLIGTRISADISQIMNIYSINAFAPAIVKQVPYTGYVLTDLDRDSTDELMVVNYDSATLSGKALLYEYEDGSFDAVFEEHLSSGIDSIYSINTGMLLDRVNAVFVTSVYAGTGRVTDILAMNKGKLQNISYDLPAGCSTDTITYGNFSVEDINQDGIMEIPRPRSVPDASGGETLDNFYDISWRAYSSTGRSSEVMRTYHNISEGWYIDATNLWDELVSVSRYNSNYGTRCTTFYRNGDDGNLSEIARIYVLTGDNRYSRINSTGSFLLKVYNVTVYAAKITDTMGLSEELAKEQMTNRFFLSRSNWITGVVS